MTRLIGMRHSGVKRFMEVGAGLFETEKLEEWIKIATQEREKLPPGNSRLDTGLKEGVDLLQEIVNVRKSPPLESIEESIAVPGVSVPYNELRDAVDKFIHLACQTPAYYGPTESPKIGLFNVLQEDSTVRHLAILPSISLKRDISRVSFLIQRGGQSYKIKDLDSKWAYSPTSDKPKFTKHHTADCDARFYWAVRLIDGDVVKFWLNDPEVADPTLSKGDLLDRYRYFEMREGNFYLLPDAKQGYDF